MLHLWRRLPKGLKYRMARSWYNYVSRLDPRGEILFLNHGYAPPDGEEPALDPADEADRYPIQLYHHIAAAADWTGRDALEVGCGRGGGTAYVMRTFRPRSLVGLDLAGGAIEFCQRHYRIDGLSFRQGDAQALPFPDASLDIVLNVESSGSYPDRPAFFREVVRVLKPGGHFLFGDYRNRNGMARLKRQLAATGLTPLAERDISANILRALERDDARKRRLIEERVPRPLRGTFGRFAFLRSGEGDEHSAFASGDKLYLSAAFVKPPA